MNKQNIKTNFNEWQHLITYTGSIVDVEFYYKLEEAEFGMKVKMREEVDGWEEYLGRYPTLHDAMNAVEEYKEKVEKLAKFEEELF